MAEPAGRIAALLRGALVALSLAALTWCAQWLAAQGVLSQRWIDAAVAGRGFGGYVSFLAVGALATGLGFPRQGVAFLGGYAFGTVAGSALALMATLAGCVATFAYARALAHDLVARRFGARLRRLDGFLARAPFRMTLVVRMLPVGSNVVTNLVAGATGVRLAPFLAASALGYLPQTAAFAIAGSGVRIAPLASMLLAAGLLIGSAALGLRLYREQRGDGALDVDLGTALSDRGRGVSSGRA